MSKPITPQQALNRFLQAIADEAEVNPAFRNRLLQATDTPFIVEGQDDISSMDPSELAIRYDEETFRRIYGNLAVGPLTNLLKNHNLATKEDMKFPGVTGAAKKKAFLDMLWQRARSRAEEHGRL